MHESAVLQFFQKVRAFFRGLEATLDEALGDIIQKGEALLQEEEAQEAAPFVPPVYSESTAEGDAGDDLP